MNPNVTQSQIEKALDEWLTTAGLTMQESIMIRTLRNALKDQVENFWKAAEYLHRSMPTVVNSAIDKARAQGRCQGWPNA